MTGEARIDAKRSVPKGSKLLELEEDVDAISRLELGRSKGSLRRKGKVFFRARVRSVLLHGTLNNLSVLKADAEGLHPDVNTPEQMPAFHNYLDEFLQAVRVFGILEKPVRNLLNGGLDVCS